VLHEHYSYPSKVKAHQQKQQRIANLKAELEQKDELIFQLACRLKEAEGILQNVVDQTKAKLQTLQGKGLLVLNQSDI